jgi:hypothetical protein
MTMRYVRSGGELVDVAQYKPYAKSDMFQTVLARVFYVTLIIKQGSDE